MDTSLSTFSSPGSTLEQSFQEFIELATIINLINPGKLFEDSISLGHENASRTTEQWHRFKDDFAWLGDVRRGGGSVAAVAGVIISGRPTLLLASNHGMRWEVFHHLQLVLQTLQRLVQNDTEGQSVAQRQILESSVRLSHEKVKHYSRQLSRKITSVLAGSETPVSEASRSCLVSACANSALTNMTQIVRCT